VVERSFNAKLRRAEKHVKDLEAEIERYSARHPYTVRPVFEGKKPSLRLEFTEYPEDTDISLIAGDALYNLRAALDHLMAALVPKAQQRSVYFPIFFQGVWGESVPGENEERTKTRARWRSYTANVADDAIAILKAVQPRDGARDSDPTLNFLAALNRLAVKDRHVKLPFIAPTLGQPVVTFLRADGAAKKSGTKLAAGHTLEDGARLNPNPWPDGAVDVQIEGAPVITVKVGGPNSNIQLPVSLAEGLVKVREQIIRPLAPFTRST
jgi:hypothetical protein